MTVSCMTLLPERAMPAQQQTVGDSARPPECMKSTRRQAAAAAAVLLPIFRLAILVG